MALFYQILTSLDIQTIWEISKQLLKKEFIDEIIPYNDILLSEIFQLPCFAFEHSEAQERLPHASTSMKMLFNLKSPKNVLFLCSKFVTSELKTVFQKKISTLIAINKPLTR